MGKLFLLMLSAGKLGKVAFSGGSMLLSLGVYGLMFGWRYATGFVGLLLLHELGHLVAARQRGLATSLPVFMPFAGTRTTLKGTAVSMQTEAHVACPLCWVPAVP